MSPEQAAEEYGVTRAQVEEALAFYESHRAEIDALMAEERQIESLAAHG
jgi:uncharacterized protein (DUF433 family)